MPRYRKKSVEVEAWQFNGTLDGAPEWVTRSALPSFFQDTSGHWFVRLSDGGVQLWSDENFRATYGPVEG